MYYSAAYVNLINSDYKLWSTIYLRSWLSLSSSGTCPAFMELECSLPYSEKFSIGVYPAPDKSCEHHHTCFLRSVWIPLCHQKWSHFESSFLTTEYYNIIYVHIHYSPMEDASSMYSILLFYHRVWQKAHILNVLNMHFSQFRIRCLPLGSKNSTWHSVFKHPPSLFMHLTIRLPIPHSYKTVVKYNHIISVHSVKTSVNSYKCNYIPRNQ